MEFVCRRCNHTTKQKPYRVTTEDRGGCDVKYSCMPFMCAASEEFGASHGENGISEKSR